jgi:hypothetical protein
MASNIGGQDHWSTGTIGIPPDQRMAGEKMAPRLQYRGAKLNGSPIPLDCI